MIILGSLASYATLQYLQYRDEQGWKKMEEERQKAGMQEDLTEEEIELNKLREQAKQRLNPETGEALITQQSSEQSKQLELSRLEAEKRLEEEKPATTQQPITQTQPETQELTLDQRREEAKKRLLNQ